MSAFKGGFKVNEGGDFTPTQANFRSSLIVAA